MPGDTKEPQSYGSNADWVTGKTGQSPNDPKGEPAAEHRDFYDDRRESEDSGAHQGGRTSEVQRAESDQAAGHASGESTPLQGVTTSEGGAKRDSYFKKRDYD